MKRVLRVGIIFVICFFALIYTVSFFVEAAPPSPTLLEAISKGEIPTPYYLSPEFQKGLRERGVDKPDEIYDFSPSSQDKSLNLSKPFNILVVLVEFSDKTHEVQPAFFTSSVFNGSIGANSVKNFYFENSYGLLNITTVNLPSSMGWKMAPKNYSYYVNGQSGQGVYPQNTQGLTENVVDMIDPLVNFSKYDNNPIYNV
mgnify:FL=1